jgi:hypothetical protein
MSVAIRGKLPAGDRDGLQAWTDELRTLRAPIVVVAALYPREVVEQLDNESDPFKVVLGVAQVEALSDMEADAAKALLEGQYERRTGKQPLPFGSMLDDDPGEGDE